MGSRNLSFDFFDIPVLVSECVFSLHVANVTQKTMLVIPRESQTAFRKGHVKTCHEVSSDEGLTLLTKGGCAMYSFKVIVS